MTEPAGRVWHARWNIAMVVLGVFLFCSALIDWLAFGGDADDLFSPAGFALLFLGSALYQRSRRIAVALYLASSVLIVVGISARFG